MLPGLTPAHTRKSFHNSSGPESSGARLTIEKIIKSPDDFLVSDQTGLWLLPPEVAERDAEQDIARATWLADALARQRTAEAWRIRFRQIALLLGRSAIDEAGCLTGGLRGNQTPPNATISIAELEMGSVTQNLPDEVPHISLCGNPDCYNARHHNLEFGGVRTDLERLDLNPYWYATREDGNIETIWGDVLPSIEESLKYFIEFQRANYPFVEYENSPLTATPISQVTFHPLTGCWESSLYEKNTSGLANIKNGYGIMYARQAPDIISSATGEIKPGYRRGSVLAHNLIWEVTGHPLAVDLDRNHLCNYPRCCNPLHLEQIPSDENRIHGQRARAIIRKLELKDPSTKSASLDKQVVADMYVPIRRMYAEITAEL